jgi:integrase/recombinase XerD
MIKTLRISHHNQDRIKVDFPYNQQIAATIRQIPDAKWSRTHKVWHIPYNQQAIGQLAALFPDSVIVGEQQPPAAGPAPTPIPAPDWKPAPTCATFNSCWATKAPRLPRFIPT